MQRYNKSWLFHTVFLLAVFLTTQAAWSEPIQTKNGRLEFSEINANDVQTLYLNGRPIKKLKVDGGFLSAWNFEEQFELNNSSVALVSSSCGAASINCETYMFTVLKPGSQPIFTRTFSKLQNTEGLPVKRVGNELWADLGIEAKNRHQYAVLREDGNFRLAYVPVSAAKSNKQNSADCGYLYEYYKDFVNNQECNEEAAYAAGMRSVRDIGLMQSRPASSIDWAMFENVSKKSCMSKQILDYKTFAQLACQKLPK